MSNTAAANLVLPIGLSAAALTIASGAGLQADPTQAADAITTTAANATYALHPIQVAVSIALVASISMSLPISTPPNAMAYSLGEFETRDMVRVMFMVSSIGVLAIFIGGGPIMRLWGVLP